MRKQYVRPLQDHDYVLTHDSVVTMQALRALVDLEHALADLQHSAHHSDAAQPTSIAPFGTGRANTAKRLTDRAVAQLYALFGTLEVDLCALEDRQIADAKRSDSEARDRYDALRFTLGDQHSRDYRSCDYSA